MKSWIIPGNLAAQVLTNNCTVFVGGLANLRSLLGGSSQDGRKWFVSKSPNRACSISKWPKWLIYM